MLLQFLFYLCGVLLIFLPTEIRNLSIIIMNNGGNQYSSESHFKFKIPYGCCQKRHHSLFLSLRQEPMSVKILMSDDQASLAQECEQLAGWASFLYQRDAVWFSAGSAPSLDICKQKWFLKVGKRVKQPLAKNSICIKNASFWNIIN